MWDDFVLELLGVCKVSYIYVQFIFHNVGTSILFTEFLHGWDHYSPSFANFLWVLLINFEWFMH